jgi:RES domain-containing protein
MRLWRLTDGRHPPFDGGGALRTSARWHTANGVRRVVYTAETLSLAVLESLVRVDPDDFPNNYTAYRLDLPETLAIREIDIAELPDDWRGIPAPASLRALGSAWLDSRAEPLLLVPSAIIPEERNILLNPDHPALGGLLAPTLTRPFQFDPRLWKESKS